jgi:hypothetical protein
MYVERAHLKYVILKYVMIQLTVFNKERQMAKSITFKKYFAISSRTPLP